MRVTIHRGLICSGVWFFLSLAVAGAASATNSLSWNKVTDRVNADVRDWDLVNLLERVTAETGWRIFVEPDTTYQASVKFKNLPSGEALRLLLGDLNFALVPQTNGSPHLYVFRTSLNRATRMIRAPSEKLAGDAQPRRVPNQLIVRFKPGSDVDKWARTVGAKVKGKIPELNAYLFEFDDAAAADSARLQLFGGSDVATVDYNYYLDQPQPSQGLLAASTPPLSLQLKPPGESGRIVVGLIDTAVQPLGGSLDAFMLKQISVAGEGSPDPNSPTHGTSMAETVLRSLELVTKGSTSVQILPVDVYGLNRETTTWNVGLGIVQAVNNGATVLNLSLGGGGDSTVLRDLIKSVSDRGIPIFAAAGNQPVATPFFPAAYPEVIAVTAAERGKIADYANYGSFVDVAAPDSSIIYYGDRPWYVQGTSASSAYTAGMAAGIADTTHKNWSDVTKIILRSLPVPLGKK